MQRFLILLIECSASMSVLALLFIAFTPLLSRRYTVKSLYYAWLVIVMGLIIPFRFHFDTAFIEVEIPHSPPMVRQIILSNHQANLDKVVSETALQGFPIIPIHQLAGGLWLAGLMTFAVFHGLRHFRFRKMVKRWGEEVTNHQILDVLQRMQEELGIFKQVKIQVFSCITSPMMFGFVHPVILLPATNYSQDELSFILKHELVHYKRKDLWYKTLIFLATAIHWFNPIVYLMARAIAVQCEISCDAEVLKNTDINGRLQYSKTIIGTIRTQSRMRTAFSTNFYGGKKNMKDRIFSIMDTTKKKAGAFILCLVLAGTIGTGTVFAIGNLNNDTPSVMQEVQTAILKDSDDGTLKLSTDGGQTWTDYDARETEASDIKWYTYDTYKEWLENEKKELQKLVGTDAKCWTPSKGEFTWTQEVVNETIAMYEETLEEIKNGAKVSKPKFYTYEAYKEWLENEKKVLQKLVDAGEEGWTQKKVNQVIAQHEKTLEGIKSGTTAVSSGFYISSSDSGTQVLTGVVMDKSDGEMVNFGPYETQEAMLEAVKKYLEEEVKAARLTQAEAEALYKRIGDGEGVIRAGAPTRLQAEELYTQMTDGQKE